MRPSYFLRNYVPLIKFVGGPHKPGGMYDTILVVTPEEGQAMTSRNNNILKKY